jgi:hypothetical protein
MQVSALASFLRVGLSIFAHMSTLLENFKFFFA